MARLQGSGRLLKKKLQAMPVSGYMLQGGAGVVAGGEGTVALTHSPQLFWQC